MATLARNKRARFDYDILETFEAGLVLTGQEVKSAKTGHAKLQGAFVTIRDGVAWLKNMFIAPYRHASGLSDYDPYQNRKLLLHKRELTRLRQKMEAARLTIVPVTLYDKAGRIKVELGIGRGKKQFEKRATIKQRELDRESRTRQYRPS